jgi:hypothetical protein
MLSEKICFSDKLEVYEREYCQTASELLNSKGMYILLERFSNTIIRENKNFMIFLNTYFNDEGYIDIWRIPYLLMDLLIDRCEPHEKLLSDRNFVKTFVDFIQEFYNYCVKNTELLLIRKDQFTDYECSMFHIRRIQCLYNLIIETYCKIRQKLNN